MSEVRWHSEARKEFEQIPDARERSAIQNAVTKLEELGMRLVFPHQSNVEGQPALRELRPRAGRSPWRPLYERKGKDTFVIGAVGPDAVVDRRGFNRAVDAAVRRLSEIEVEDER